MNEQRLVAPLTASQPTLWTTPPRPPEINPAWRWPTYRPHQWDAIERVRSAFASGAKVVFLDMMTGGGKSLAAETVRTLQFPEAQALYLCTTKLLQAQVEADFPYAKIIMGRDNYGTRHYPEHISCGGCDLRKIIITDDAVLPDKLADDIAAYGLDYVTRSKGEERWADFCELCSVARMCPYRIAKREAMDADLTVANTAYYLREANGPGGLKNREFVTVDEADAFEGVLLAAFTVNVPGWLLESSPLPATASNPDDLMEWKEIMVPHLKGWRASLRDKDHWREKWGMQKLRQRRNTVEGLLTNLDLADETWLYSGPSRRSRKKYQQAILQPVWVDREWAKPYVWDHAENWLLMSASFVSMELTAHTLGLEPDECEFVKVDYSFPVDRRPVRFWPSPKPYTHTAKVAGFDVYRDMVRKITTISGWYPDVRIIVHTQSHERTKQIMERLKLERPVFHYTTTGGPKEKAIDNYLATDGAMLVGAGLERGYDFPGESCRVAILCKTPYADLKDPIVTARLHGPEKKLGQADYELSTARTTVQTLGRGMRSETDRCVSYLLDASFGAYIEGHQSRWMPTEVLAAIKPGVPTGPE